MSPLLAFFVFQISLAEAEVVWTLGKGGQSCSDVCQGGCVEGSWPTTAEQFKEIAADVKYECPFHSIAKECDSSQYCYHDGTAPYFISVPNSPSRGQCFRSGPKDHSTCEAKNKYLARFCPCQKKDDLTCPDCTDPPSFTNKVTLDVSSVAKDQDSILQFTKKVFTNLQKVLADNFIKATPRFDDESVLSKLDTKKPRAVQFLDTPDCRLHKQSKFILRYRYSLNVPPSSKADITFKSRSDAFSTNDWTEKMSVSGGLQYETKLKEQGTAGSNQTAYAFYRQFKKAKYMDPLLRQLGMDSFTSGTIDQWAGTFPGLASLGERTVQIPIGSNGLTIRQEEVEQKDAITVTLGANQVTTMEPSVVLWFDEESNSNAFAGELTWDSTVNDTTMPVLFNAIVASTLEGMVGSGSKTTAAYARMDCKSSGGETQQVVV